MTVERTFCSMFMFVLRIQFWLVLILLITDTKFISDVHIPKHSAELLVWTRWRWRWTFSVVQQIQLHFLCDWTVTSLNYCNRLLLKRLLFLFVVVLGYASWDTDSNCFCIFIDKFLALIELSLINLIFSLWWLQPDSDLILFIACVNMFMKYERMPYCYTI